MKKKEKLTDRTVETATTGNGPTPDDPKTGSPDNVPESIRVDRATGAQDAAKKNIETRETVDEVGGADAPEPTRYGDWEYGGRCSDF